MRTKTDMRIAECALFLESLLDCEADLFELCTEDGAEEQEKSIEAAARCAGYTDAEITEAWAVVNA